MTECGFDEAGIDAVGNVVGVYHGGSPHARRLLAGSHYDTVRMAAGTTGRLGILVPMACVAELHRQRRRLPFGIEVVAFAEEEGQRYKATFLRIGRPARPVRCGLAGPGRRRRNQHARGDAHGGPAADAAAIRALARDPTRYLGFVEVHIEQGPVLAELDLPLGIVTSINGGVRYLGEIVGVASHAGTTPMAGAATPRRRRPNSPSSSRSAPRQSRNWWAPWACSKSRPARST